MGGLEMAPHAWNSPQVLSVRRSHSPDPSPENLFGGPRGVQLHVRLAGPHRRPLTEQIDALPVVSCFTLWSRLQPVWQSSRVLGLATLG